MATEPQLSLIKRLCSKKIPLASLAKHLGKESLEELSIAEASQLIERLLDVRERERIRDAVLSQDVLPLFGDLDVP